MNYIICTLKIINITDWPWSSLPISIADILIIINNSCFAEIINYFKYLSEAGSIKALLCMYTFMYVFVGILLGLRFFINVLLDPLIEHLITEYEKEWSWEEPTHYRNGLDYLPNVLMSLGRLTQKAKDDLAEIRRQEAEHKKIMERQAEKIRLNKIEYEKYLEYRRENPLSEEEKKSELKFILDEMHKEYGHLFDEENPQ